MAKKFLPNVSLNHLRTMEKNEKDPKAKMILLACIAKKEKKKLKDIALTLNKPYNTVRNWVNRIARDGLKHRHDIKHKGAKCKLDDGQIKKLLKALDNGPRAAGFETNLWTLRLINKYIKREFDADYHDESVWQLMRRLGYRPVVPRPRHPKSATPQEREAFKKKAHKMSAIWRNREYIVLTQDEAHIQLKIVPRTTWSRKKNPVIPTNGMWGSKRVTMMCVIGEDGLNYFDFYDAGNWKNMKDFLLKVYKQFGPVLIFLDNAPYHQKHKLKALTRETDGEMQFRFLPKYTPELNPTEAQWPICKNWIYSMPLRDTKQLAREMRSAIKHNIIKIVKLHDCYTP